MSINKDSIKKQNVKKVYQKGQENARSSINSENSTSYASSDSFSANYHANEARKSSDFSFSNSNNAKSSSSFDMSGKSDTQRKSNIRYKGNSHKRYKNKSRNNQATQSSANKDNGKSNIDKKLLRKQRLKKAFRNSQEAKFVASLLQNNNENNGQAQNDAISQDTIHVAKGTVRYAYGKLKKKHNKNSQSDTKSETSKAAKKYDNVSRKSNMLSSDKSKSQNSSETAKKKAYKKNRKKVYKQQEKKLKQFINKITGKDKAEKTVKAKIVVVLLKWLAGIISFIMGNWLICMPIIILLFSAVGGEAMSQAEMMAAYTYPASDADITSAIEYWQMLQVSIKSEHRKVPDMEGIAGKYDEKKSSVCTFMTDNNKLLSFLSAYYIPYVDAWHFEDTTDLMNEVFGKMYSITYILKPDTQNVTETKIIPESELPSPLPNTYTILAHNGSEYVVKISEVRDIVVLEYNIEENMTWDEILSEYLSEEQMQKYQNYYDMKGGAIKAFSSPFAFAWEGYITSYFGYRTWEDGSVEYHKGVDFGVPHGTEELAIADGTVVKVYTSCTHDYAKDYGCGCGGNYGNYVDIITDDGTYYICYGHMADVYVNVGDKIKNGQVIGTAGCTGWSTGNHLHLELRLGTADGQLIDPLTYIQSYVPIKETTEN